MADRNGRHYDRQLRRDGHSSRFDGPTSCRASKPESCARPRTAGEHRATRRPRRTGPASRLAFLLFRGYWNEPERYKKCFAEGWYLTGDLAKRDEDGYFWFVGRADDVIKTSGHLIGPSKSKAP
ncbi:MAG: AMP-binding protein [Nitrospiraceae bacterium]